MRIQGEGPHTARKENGFAAAFAILLRVSRGRKGRLLHFPYWHCDLNAGSGWNKDADCPGSPLVFLDQAIAEGRQVNAWFCDNDPEAITLLRGRLAPYSPLPPGGSVHGACCNNAAFLHEFAEAIVSEEDPRYAVGSVLCDPNGPRTGFPAAALADFSACFKRIDLVLNLNVSTIRKGLGARRAGLKGHHDWQTLDEMIQPLGKPVWLIRNLPPNGKGDLFVTLIGTRLPLSGSKRLEFYRLDSKVGQQILHGLKRVDVDQPSLFKED